MKKILVVDDEEKILDIYLRLLLPEGLIVRCAHNAQAATSILVRESIDLVVLDINMPHIDGHSLFEVIKQFNPHIKVIVSSAYPIEQQMKRVPSAEGYYDKAEGFAVLLERVQQALVHTPREV